MNWTHELLVPGDPLPSKRRGEGFAKWKRKLTPEQLERLEAVAVRLGIEERSLWQTYLPTD